MTTSSGHVFVSHGSENREQANALAEMIEARGIKVWIAPRDVRPGMDYSEQLQGAIEGCGAFLVLVTDKANKSPYVRAETEMAFSTHKPIFPIRMSDIAPAAGLALFLKIRHWTDAFGPEREANLERLVHELEAVTGGGGGDGPAPVPPPPQEPTPPPPPPPPAPPPPPPPPREPEPALQDEARLRAAIGPNADYYLSHWRATAAKGGIIDWNWAACLANLFWFAYRRMWGPFAAVAGAIVLLGLIGAAAPALGAATGIASIAITFVTGAIGNHLYRRQTERLLAATAGMDEGAAQTVLAARGGVSKGALYATIGAVTVIVLLAVAGAAMEQEAQKAREKAAQERVNRAFEDAYRDQSGGAGGGQPNEGDKPLADEDVYYPD